MSSPAPEPEPQPPLEEKEKAPPIMVAAARALVESGKTDEQILSQFPDVGKMRLLGIRRQWKQRIAKQNKEKEEPQVIAPSLSAPPPQNHDTEIDSIMREDSRLALQGIWTDVLLNPKFRLFYSYVVKQGYRGSMSRFVNDCVEEAMKNRGIRVAIEQLVE